MTTKKEAVLNDDKSKPVPKLRAPIIDRQVIKKMIIDNMSAENIVSYILDYRFEAFEKIKN